MIKTKLTVRVEPDLLKKIKHYASKHNTTITELLNTWLTNIPDETSLGDAPIVKRLAGSVSQTISLEDYHNHLEEKYAG